MIEDKFRFEIEVTEKEMKALLLLLESYHQYDMLHTAKITKLRQKMSPEQVIEIRERYAAGGITHQALADEYNISAGHISRITQGKMWADVGGPIIDGRPRRVWNAVEKV